MRRVPCWHEIERAIAGVKNGKPYNKAAGRRTKCLDCGQHCRDKSYVCEPEEAGLSESG